LFEKRAIPQQDLDNAKASVQVGEASIQSALARVDAAKLDVSYCIVNAPITGMIGAKQVSIGDLVGKGELTLLATISSQEKIWFYCNISEVDYLEAEAKSGELGRVLDVLPFTLILPNGLEHPERGRLVFVDRAVDVKTATLRLRAESTWGPATTALKCRSGHWLRFRGRLSSGSSARMAWPANGQSKLVSKTAPTC
jgi:membrane fusion protein (multidrug efflux system)